MEKTDLVLLYWSIGEVGIMILYNPNSPEIDFDFYLVKYRYEVLLPRFKYSNFAVELGCGTVFSLEILAKLFDKIFVVEKNKEQIEYVKRKIPENIKEKFKFLNTDWLSFSKLREIAFFDNYDIIFFEGIEYLEHQKSIYFLKNLKDIFKNFRLHLVTSNKKSLHRRLGFYMGLLDNLDSLKYSSKIASMKKWLADRYTLLSLLKQSGYEVKYIEPYFLKILPNDFLKKLPENIIEALFDLGKELPDYCAEIYVYAEPLR